MKFHFGGLISGIISRNKLILHRNEDSCKRHLNPLYSCIHFFSTFQYMTQNRGILGTFQELIVNANYQQYVYIYIILYYFKRRPKGRVRATKNHYDGMLSNHLKYLIRATNISAYSNLYV